MRSARFDRAAARGLVAGGLLLGLWAGAGSAAPAGAAEPGAAATPAAAAESVETRWLANVRPLGGDFKAAGEAYFSPDGSQIVFQAIPRDYLFYRIYTQPLAGGEPRLVSPGRGRTTCAYFTRDGKQILFASSHLDPQLDATEDAERSKQAEDARTGRRRRYEWVFDPWMDLFVRDLETGGLTQLTDEPGYDAEGSYSPDGKQIVFCSTRDGDPDLYVMDADGSHVRQLTNVPGYDGGPFFSPDGKWVVFRSDRKKPDHLQIMAIRVADGKEISITDDADWVHWAPYWHPTRPLLIWCGADHSSPMARPNYDLWMVEYRAEGDSLAFGPRQRITDNSAGDVLPVFSPDGQSLLWTSTRGPDHSSQLWHAELKWPEGK